MENITQLSQDLEEAIVSSWNDYIDLHSQFDEYRGRGLTPQEGKELNEIFILIQEKFQELYPALYFIGKRAEFAGNAADGFKKFIDEMEKGGALAKDADGKLIKEDRNDGAMPEKQP